MVDELIIIDPSRDALRESEHYEDIFTENGTRWVLLPLEYPSLFELYKRIENGFWTPDDFSWQDDQQKLLSQKCPAQALHAIYTTALHYLTIHGHPNAPEAENVPDNEVFFHDFLDLSCELTEAVQSPEARAYLGFQAMFENFHRETLTRWTSVCRISLGLSSTAIEHTNTTVERTSLSDRNGLPELKRKHNWLSYHLEGFYAADKVKVLAGDDQATVYDDAKRYLNSAPMAEVLISLSVLYGMFFSGLSVVMSVLSSHGLEDSSIYKSAKKLYQGLTLHGDFAMHLYSSLETKLSYTTLCKLLVQAAQIEYEHLNALFSPADLNSQELLLLHRSGFMNLVERIALRMIKGATFYEPNDVQDQAEKELIGSFKNAFSQIAPASGSARALFETEPAFVLNYKGPFHIVPIEKKAQNHHDQVAAAGHISADINTNDGNLFMADEDDF